MADQSKSYERAMTLAALSGLKIALGPAFLRSSRRQSSASNWVLAALGEMALDKLGVFPSRFRPGLLVPHTLAGAWVARESLKEDGIDAPQAALMGAIMAAGVASVAPMVRITIHKGLGIPDWMLGLAEDYLALKLGTQSMGMSMDEVKGVARDAVGDLGVPELTSAVAGA